MRTRRLKLTIDRISRAMAYTPISLMLADFDKQQWLVVAFPDFESSWRMHPRESAIQGDGKVIGRGTDPWQALEDAERTVRRLLVKRVGGSRTDDGPWWVTA